MTGAIKVVPAGLTSFPRCQHQRCIPMAPSSKAAATGLLCEADKAVLQRCVCLTPRSRNFPYTDGAASFAEAPHLLLVTVFLDLSAFSPKNLLTKDCCEIRVYYQLNRSYCFLIASLKSSA